MLRVSLGAPRADRDVKIRHPSRIDGHYPLAFFPTVIDFPR